MRVYLDAAPVIYLVEQVEPYASELETLLSVPGTTQVCSDLTRLECRVKPIRDHREALLSAFDRYLHEIVAEVLPLSARVMDKATILRARYGFRTPDAIHLAAAIVHECDLFLTNDRHLRQCAEIAVETI